MEFVKILAPLILFMFFPLLIPAAVHVFGLVTDRHKFA